MPTVYTSIHDAIHKRRWKVYIPENYQYRLPEYSFTTGSPPLYEPSNGEDMCISRLPITHIVDMCFKNITFSIPNIRDLSSIIDLLSSYIASMEHMKNKDADLDLFIERCQQALNKLYPVSQRTKKKTQFGKFSRPDPKTTIVGILKGIDKVTGRKT